jgi:Ca2+-transporting ATPase
MLVAALVGLPLPLLPLHLLWINIVTDGLPALALVMDPAGESLLKRPPRHPEELMLGWSQWKYIIGIGALEASLTLAVFVWALHSRDLANARSLAFSTLVFAELLRAFAARSTTSTFWGMAPFSNLRLIAVIVMSLIVQVGLQQWPLTRYIFDLSEAAPWDWTVAALVGLVPVTVLECIKLLAKRGGRQSLSVE